MRIVEKGKRLVKFEDLEQGEVFRAHNEIFIKVQFDKHSDINAVRLCDGAKHIFRSYFDQVEPLRATLTIEGDDDED